MFIWGGGGVLYIYFFFFENSQIHVLTETFVDIY